MNRSFIYWLLPCLLFVLSCNDEDKIATYSVDSELDSYLQRFLSEAHSRNIDFDLETEGIIMEFADLPLPKIGLCHFSNPIKVQIDRTFWRETEGKADQESQRENTVFHELGHGLLRRQHVNSKLPNTEWRSIMCGGEQVEDRGWFVNFTGARKKYYLDELFLPQTAPADFLSMKKQEVKKGSLIKKVDLSQPVYIANSGSIDALNSMLEGDFGSDFYVEAKVSLDSTKNRHVGLFVGSEEASNYFNLYANGRAVMANTSCFQPFAEVFLTSTESMAKGDFTIGLLKQGDEQRFLLGDLCFYWNDFPFAACNKVGLYLPAGDKVILKSFAVYQLKN